ncbi:aminocarboxymuconate-semialdehyde decarboxylase [Thermocatellispora tengchongensis]|uniref:Aminocarboxymuconate-semialdehyde decarboxylase n=1 Tax=Thermocatellispora tengchongensis TaxID=1073253 RepID=A0A840PI84_9ACTN|nr:amidohydrolase family protein [Thermocatellispora tengchongensis]MBB5139258.1 aminocarboxymuconate-semialdehyde decarboxylase [Thermocatellispora tengchongensis]
MLVDAHAHLLPRDYPAGSPACFPRMEPIDGDTARLLLFGNTRFRAREVFFDAERRVEAMDASGVTAEVLTPMPPLLRYDLPPADGLSLARHVNDFTATLCATAPDRLIGFGLVPMQDPDAATAELKAMREMGLIGVEIASNILGASIGEERFLPFFAEAERLNMPIFVHALPAPTGRLPRAATGTYVVGLEGTIAAASLITGGTAAKCPGLRVSFSHAAGGFPLIVPRAQYFWSGTWNEEPPIPDRALAWHDGPSPLEYARRFYYDSMVFDRRALRFLIDLLGHDRLLVGSDFPAMEREHPADRTLRSLGLPAPVLADITWHNAYRYLGIDPPAALGP